MNGNGTSSTVAAPTSVLEAAIAYVDVAEQWYIAELERYGISPDDLPGATLQHHVGMVIYATLRGLSGTIPATVPEGWRLVVTADVGWQERGNRAANERAAVRLGHRFTKRGGTRQVFYLVPPEGC